MSSTIGLEDAERRHLIARACGLVDSERLAELVSRITDVPSPTGEEAPLADLLVAELAEAGLRARAQPLDDHQANAVASLPGSGGGPALLLYAPIDTLTTGLAEEDLPWIGPELRPDMLPTSQRLGNLVVGLGASNPKGHAACVVVAAEALARCGQQLPGDLLVGLGAGGMPTNAWRPSGRRNVGQGVGCAFLLEQGCWPDFAIVAKPGWTISREEVGLSWFDITVRGTHTYVGSRHRLPYRNAIADAAEVVRFLEEWFPRYSEKYRSGEVAPQGIVAAIEGGWPRIAALTPAACRIRVDLRTSPRTTPAEARRAVAGALEEFVARGDGIELELEQVLAIPAGSTDENSWIVRCAVAAWEEASGLQHHPSSDLSGATDANILRGRGIPTVRVGMAKVAEAPYPIDFAAGMNTVDVGEMVRLTHLLIGCAVETCGRSLSAVGL